MAAIVASGSLFAVLLAGAVTALVALGMLISHLRRTSRLTLRTGGLGAASAMVVVAACALVGSIAVDEQPEPSAALLEVTPYALEAYQLETLSFR